MAWCLTVEVHI